MINKIAKGKCNRNNRYFIPELYVEILVSKLQFNDGHELLWGNDEEIGRYVPKLFECLINDCVNENIEIKSDILFLLLYFGRLSTEITPEKVDNLLIMKIL